MVHPLESVKSLLVPDPTEVSGIIEPLSVF
jgi:hypothetical protein